MKVKAASVAAVCILLASCGGDSTKKDNRLEQISDKQVNLGQRSRDSNMEMMRQTFSLLNTSMEFEFIKARTDSKQAPWSMALEKLKKSPQAVLSYKPEPANEVFKSFYYPEADPVIGVYELQSDAHAVYEQSVLWALTRDTRYAENALKIIDAWASRNSQGIRDEQDGMLVAGWTAPLFMYGAQILKSSYPKWNAEIETKLNVWINQTYVPLFNKYLYDLKPTKKGLDPNEPWPGNRLQSAGYYWYRRGNYTMSILEGMMAISIFQDNKAGFDKTVAFYKDVKSKTFYGRGNKYGYPAGHMQETCRDAAHAQYVLGSAVNIAEMAWHQGVDLYGTDDNLLAESLEYHARIILGESSPSCRHAKDRIEEKHASGWETGIRHYSLLKKMPMPHSEKLMNKKGRPDARRHTEGSWTLGTLTHYKVPDFERQRP